MTLNLAMRVVSLVSLVSSSSVVVTIASFSTMRESFFTRIIGMIAFSDMIVGIVGLIGFPSKNSLGCDIQAGFETFFLRANWFWTATLVYQMYRFIASNRVLFDEFKMHAIIWSLCALLTGLPLIDASFGRVGIYGSTEMCFISSNNTTWIITWMMIDWTVTTIVVILFMFFYVTKILALYRNAGSDEAFTSSIRSLVKSLYAYPLIMLFTWGVNAGFNLMVLILKGIWQANNWDDYVVGVSTVSAMTNGTFLGIFVFTKSPEARYRWRKFLGLISKDDIHTHTLDFQESISNSLLHDPLFSDSTIRPTSGSLQLSGNC
jgi:hypothetical protein